jgi:protein TonB
MRNMKTPWAIRSVASLYTVILSVSIHVLIFSIPISMVIKPQTQEMELFVSIEDVQVSPEPVKKRVAIKKPHAQPQPEPVKEIIKPIEPCYPIIENPEIVEPVKEVIKEPVVETKEEPIRLEPISQPATESKEPLFIPHSSNITERNSHEPGEGGTIGMVSDAEKQSLVSHNGGYRNDTGNPIETRFGASVAPAFLHREMPVYPMMARKLGKEGKVVLKLTIDENGNLQNVEVIDEAGYGFTEAAVEAVKKSTFLPAKKDGKPVASRALLPIRFRLERS